MSTESSASFFERMQKWLQNPLTLFFLGGGLILIFLIVVGVTFLSWQSPRPSIDSSAQQVDESAASMKSVDSLQHVPAPDTRTAFCQSYFKNDSRVFLDEKELLGVDPLSFRVVGYLPRIPVLYNYACVTADKNAVYVDEERIPFLDPASIAILGVYLKDDEGVYVGTERTDADPATFQVESPNDVLGKDEDAVYLCGVSFMPYRPGAEALGGYYGKMGSSVYYKGVPIPGASADFFEVLGGVSILPCESKEGGYAKDDGRVYFNGAVIEGADPTSFVLGNDELGVAYDNTSEYRDGVKIVDDFTRCSQDATELPEGIETNQSADLFEFCTTLAGEVIVSYQPDKWIEAKNVELFSAEGVRLRRMELICDQENDEYAAANALQGLDGTTLSLVCLEVAACSSRVFYELDLDRWRDFGVSTLQKIDEWRDCGYRG